MKKKQNKKKPSYNFGGLLKSISPLLAAIPGAGVPLSMGASMIGGQMQQNAGQPTAYQPIQENNNPYGYNTGGRIPRYNQGGQMNQLSSNAMQVDANGAGTDTVPYQGAMVDNNEIIKGDKVFSDDLTNPFSNMSYAADAKKIEQAKGKSEAKLKDVPTDHQAQATIKLMDQQSDKLFEHQEMLATIKGLRNRPQDQQGGGNFQYGGRMNYEDGGPLRTPGLQDPYTPRDTANYNGQTIGGLDPAYFGSMTVGDSTRHGDLNSSAVLGMIPKAQQAQQSTPYFEGSLLNGLPQVHQQRPGMLAPPVGVLAPQAVSNPGTVAAPTTGGSGTSPNWKQNMAEYDAQQIDNQKVNDPADLNYLQSLMESLGNSRNNYLSPKIGGIAPPTNIPSTTAEPIGQGVTPRLPKPGVQAPTPEGEGAFGQFGIGDVLQGVSGLANLLRREDTTPDVQNYRDFKPSYVDAKPILNRNQRNYDAQRYATDTGSFNVNQGMRQQSYMNKLNSDADVLGQVQQQNVGIGNQAAQYNVQSRNQIDDINARRQAAGRNMERQQFASKFGTITNLGGTLNKKQENEKFRKMLMQSFSVSKHLKV